MKTNGVHGLNYHFFPGDLSNKLDADIVAAGVEKIMSGENQIHIFTGPMPTEEELYAFTSVADLLDPTTGYGSNLAISVGVTAEDAFEVKYTYSQAKKERVCKKWPVNARMYTSIVAGVLTWAAIRLEGVTPTEGMDQMIFTDAIGAWDDLETIVLLDKVVVEAGEEVEVKDFTFASRDVLADDLADELNPATIVFDASVVSGTSTVIAAIGDVLDGENVDVQVILAGETTGISYVGVVAAGAISVDISADFPDGLAVGDKVLANVAGTYASLVIA